MAHKKSKTRPIVWLRRGFQTFFLLLFLYLFLQTTFHPINQVGGHVTLFFELDPLVMLTSWVSAHTVPAVLLLSLVTLGATLFFGRWFCGWVCPFGVLHNLLTALRGDRLKHKLDRGGYTSWQKAKYIVLVFFLLGAVTGANIVGWLDPFSFFYRSMATAVYPALNAGAVDLFTWLYQKDPGISPAKVTLVSEPVYDFLRTYFLAVEQPFYYGGLLVGVLFLIVAGLNFYRARFWCRYICPLGALLGVVGKNPLLRLQKNPDLCNDCRLCLSDCQGGAEPQSIGNWKPSECFYCWNCESDCPSNAISFGFEIPPETKP